VSIKFKFIKWKFWEVLIFIFLSVNNVGNCLKVIPLFLTLLLTILVGDYDIDDWVQPERITSAESDIRMYLFSWPHPVPGGRAQFGNDRSKLKSREIQFWTHLDCTKKKAATFGIKDHVKTSLGLLPRRVLQRSFRRGLLSRWQPNGSEGRTISSRKDFIISHHHKCASMQI
jgi:hypothetical protein